MDGSQNAIPDPLNPSVQSQVEIPLGPRNNAVSHIERLLESILDAISDGNELRIPYKSTRPPPTSTGSAPNRRDDGQQDVVRFPGRTIQEAKKFGMGRRWDFIFIPLG